MQAATASSGRSHIPQLDGWRGLSIVLVLMTHLLPLGPAWLKLNTSAGLIGMGMFFTLSGYLITSFLLERPDVKAFLIRRVLRIVPLAWTVLLLTAPLSSPFSPGHLLTRLLFAQNYVYSAITPYDSHYWSLGVEMHFYAGVALIVAVAGRRGLFLLPWLCLAVTATRVWLNAPVSINTHLRVDEILAGASLALLRTGHLPRRLAAPMRVVPPWAWLLLLAASSHGAFGPLQFARPYFGALLIGSSLYQQEHWLSRFLVHPVLSYLATVSFALYVIHGPLRAGWFAEGGRVTRYLIKRPLTLLLTFALAHLSTFYFESRWIALARRLTRRAPRATAQADASTALPRGR
jgi:peptidoglycan/LPS O-acetylase OafA/YrhL